MWQGLIQIQGTVHTYVVKVVFDTEELTSLLDKVHLLKGDFFINNKHNILIRLRFIMEPSSDFVWTPMNAGVVKLWISRVCQVNFSEESSFKKIPNVFLWYSYLSVDHNGLFGLDFGQVIDVRFLKRLFSAVKTERNL
jgi:hypothetical protein